MSETVRSDSCCVMVEGQERSGQLSYTRALCHVLDEYYVSLDSKKAKQYNGTNVEMLANEL